MGRKPRIHVPGGFYHAILRGNSRQDIFFSNSDRHTWESLVTRSIPQNGHRIHAYCWMTNHVHLAIQAGTQPLGGFMSFLASNYARKINKRMQRSGHLFERRYRAILIQEDCYLQELVRYIHMNPVRAGMVDVPAEYLWSSHHAYMGVSHPDWLTVSKVLSMFSPSKLTARRRYTDFMCDQQAEPVSHMFRTGSADDDRTLGSDGWLEQVLGDTEVPKAKMSLDELIKQTCDRHAITEQQLASHSRSRHLAKIRAEITLAAVENQIATTSEVARRFRRSQPTMSRAMHQLMKRRDKL